MLFRETVAVYCDNNTGHTNTLCGQNAKIFLFLTQRYIKQSLCCTGCSSEKSDENTVTDDSIFIKTTVDFFHRKEMLVSVVGYVIADVRFIKLK
jgi:hypothetical protein